MSAAKSVADGFSALRFAPNFPAVFKEPMMARTGPGMWVVSFQPSSVEPEPKGLRIFPSNVSALKHGPESRSRVGATASVHRTPGLKRSIARSGAGKAWAKTPKAAAVRIAVVVSLGRGEVPCGADLPVVAAAQSASQARPPFKAPQARPRESTGLLRLAKAVEGVNIHRRPNPSLNRTRNGMPGLGFISFLPKPVTPPRAG